MSSRYLFSSILMACVLTFGLHGNVQVAHAASAKSSAMKSGKITKYRASKFKRRGPGRRVVFPIAPSYLAYDYPYYYGRGYYPTHIGPGYIYYGYPYRYRRDYYPQYSRW